MYIAVRWHWGYIVYNRKTGMTVGDVHATADAAMNALFGPTAYPRNIAE